MNGRPAVLDLFFKAGRGRAARFLAAGCAPGVLTAWTGPCDGLGRFAIDPAPITHMPACQRQGDADVIAFAGSGGVKPISSFATVVERYGGASRLKRTA